MREGFGICQKLHLCKICYYLDDYPELFDFSVFGDTVVKPYLETLPFLSDYTQIFFDYGKHLYCCKQNIIQDKEDQSFIYCLNLLTEYRLLLIGKKLRISISDSKNLDKKRNGKPHIPDENYRNILMAGLENEMRKYNLHHIAKSEEDINQEIENGKNTEWISKCMKIIDKNCPKYPIKEKVRLLFNSYALAFPIVVERFTVEHVDFMIERGLEVNRERQYIRSKGRPSYNFESDCMRKLFDLLILDSVLDYKEEEKRPIDINEKVRHEFIYDFVNFFKIYTTRLNNNTTTKSDLIKELIK